jgi:hypothetical protein
MLTAAIDEYKVRPEATKTKPVAKKKAGKK